MRGRGVLLHRLVVEGIHRGSMHDYGSKKKQWPEEIEQPVAETKDVT